MKKLKIILPLLAVLIAAVAVWASKSNTTKPSESEKNALTEVWVAFSCALGTPETGPDGGLVLLAEPEVDKRCNYDTDIMCSARYKVGPGEPVIIAPGGAYVFNTNFPNYINAYEEARYCPEPQK